MKWCLLLIMLAGLRAAHADDLAPLIQSVGACQHLSVKRTVHLGDEKHVGPGFEYETSDPKKIARVLRFFARTPTRDTWMRFEGAQPTPDAMSVLSLDFSKASGRTVNLFIIEPRDLVFDRNPLFRLQIKNLTEFYRLIGKEDVVSHSIYATFTLDTFRYDGADDYHSRQRKVRDVQPVNRQPLFDNVPFFRLREGDRLVKARAVAGVGPGKAGPGKKQGDLQYYLESGENYFLLPAREKDGKLLLSETPDSASACVLFDWEVTFANAQVIRAMLPREWSESFSREKYDEIVRATRSQFPQLITPETVLDPYPHEDQISTVPGLFYAEFDGFLFDRRQGAIDRYTIRIGPSSFFVRTTPLLQGPRESTRSASATARRKKAPYEPAIEFQTMVQGIIQSGGNTGGGAP